MASKLISWEIDFAKALEQVDTEKRKKAGALLPIVPDRGKWEEFIETARGEWKAWRGNLDAYPTCLVVLFGGLAFYEYDENTFWPYFAEAVGSNTISPNQQRDITAAFSKWAEMLGLRIHRRERASYVGSAVYHIGIPLSLWDGFLEICEWALCREDWRTLPEQEWADAVEKRTLSRLRLKRFLVDNREAASSFIQDMLDVREILSNEQNLTIDAVAQASILRNEYFDEVPETAEFLRPENPESLFQDRARIIWDDHKRQISLHLPAVKSDKLPATWRVGTHTQKAATTPDELILDSLAFRSSLLLSLEAGPRRETQRLLGIEPWGLFDLEAGGRLINSNRDTLPLKSYALISQKKVEELFREGFDEEDNPANEPFELVSGTPCFVTRLWPTGKFAELKLRDEGGVLRVIRFRTKARIEAKFFVGRGYRAAFFSRIAEDKVKIEDLPTLCVSIPFGYFRDSYAEVRNKFKVRMDDKLADGRWEFSPTGDGDKEVYFWKWSRKPFMEPRSGVGVIRSLRSLREAYVSPDLKGDRTLSIKGPAFDVNYKIYLDHSKRGMDDCWKNLPGAYVSWFLLCQSKEGLKWDDLMFAKDVITPDLWLSYYLLRKYADRGFFSQQGHRWLIRESRAVLRRLAGGKCYLEYCGDPSVLWGLYRLMYYKAQGQELPIIEVIDKRGEVPYLQMLWDQSLRRELARYLEKNNVVIRTDLWSH